MITPSLGQTHRRDPEAGAHPGRPGGRWVQKGSFALSSHVLYLFFKYTEDCSPGAANLAPFPGAKIPMEGFKSNIGLQGHAWIPFT